MSDNSNQPRSDADSQLEREIRAERKFTLEEAIGRLAGPGAMKGASPIARQQQAEAEIGNWLTVHLGACKEALQVVLLRQIAQSDLLLNNSDQPLVVLAAYCRHVLDSDSCLKDLVRDADIEWGQVFGERPCFDRDGVAPNPDDPYTIESVRIAVSGLFHELATGQA